MTKRAPARTFFSSLRYCGTSSRSWRLWFVTTQPRKKSVCSRRVPGRRSSERPAFRSEKSLSRPTESMSKTGLASPSWPVTGKSPDMQSTFWKPSEASFQPRLSRAFRFQSLQARWMITSCPRETRSVPSVSGASIACPPGLSVIERTSMRGSSASSRASRSTLRPRSALITPRLVTTSAATTNASGVASFSRNVMEGRLAALHRGLRPPAGRVLRAGDLRVRTRTHDRADLDLLVPLDDRPRRAAALLAPDERDLVADLDVVVDDREREHRPLVEAVPRERRDADGLVVHHHAVVRPGRVVREREVDVLRRIALLEERAHRADDVVGVPAERHLMPGRLHLPERVPADEVMVELHKRPVAEIPRGQVVVLDVVGHEAASERACCLVPIGGKPLAVRLHLLAREDGGERGRDPAGLERVRCVGARSDLPQPEVATSLDDRAADLLALLPRAEELHPLRTRHPVVKRPHLSARDRELAQAEEPDLRERPAGCLLEDVQRRWALHLEAIQLAATGRIDGCPLVAVDADVVAARLGVVLHPVVRRRTPDQAQ